MLLLHSRRDNNHLIDLWFFTKSTPKRICRLLHVRASSWVRYTKRAVDPEAVICDESVWIPLVTSLAEVCCAEAVILCNRAAVIAFPHYVLASVLWALAITTTVYFDLALFAAEGLFIDVLFGAKLLHAVCCATKVWLFAVVALKECAWVHGELQFFSLINVSWCGQSLSVW